MSEDNFCADLRNVVEGDSVTLTVDGDRLPAECIKVSTDQDPDPEVVREFTKIWFMSEGAECMVQITDGLRRFDWEDPYPRQTNLYDDTNDLDRGPVTAVEIHGPKLEG